MHSLLWITFDSIHYLYVIIPKKNPDPKMTDTRKTQLFCADDIHKTLRLFNHITTVVVLATAAARLKQQQ